MRELTSNEVDQVSGAVGPGGAIIGGAIGAGSAILDGASPTEAIVSGALGAASGFFGGVATAGAGRVASSLAGAKSIGFGVGTAAWRNDS